MSTRRSKRRSSVAASAAISEQAPGGGSANSATNSGNASSTTSSRTTSSKSRTRTPRPTTELLGKRISVTWPKDKTTYPARVIDYNEKKKIHRVIYDIDNSIEELNLARRKYTAIAPEGDEANEKCIIGKKIILEVAVNDEVEDDDAPKDDYTCMVLRKSCDVEDEEEEGEGGDDDEEKKESDETSVMVDVIYLANEYITSVDLSKHNFVILDMQSGEKVREVAEGHSSLFVEIQCTEGGGESVEVEEKKEEAAVKPDTKTSETDATPIARAPTAETTGEKTKPETEIETETEKHTAPVPANGEAGNGDGEEDGLMNDDPPLAAETTADAKASEKAPEMIIIEDESEEDIEEPKKTEAPKDAKMDDAESKAWTAPQSRPKVAAEEVVGSAMPEEGKTEQVKKADAEKSNVVETEKADEAMDIVPAIEEGPKSVKEASAVLATTDETVIDGGNELEKMADVAPEAGASDAVKETSKPAADVVNPEVNSAQKQQPLTAENIKILEGSTQNGVAAKKVAEADDDDVKTLSDADNEQWIASSSITLPDPESVVKKFVGIKTSSEKERVAFVEAHLSSGNHFLEFHDKEGGSTQLVLTTENCRLLSEEEIEKLGGKQAGAGITPGPATGSNKRKNMNGKESSNKRRRANSDMASPKPKPKAKSIRLPKLPPPGSEIVGKVITIEWPGNTELYKGLVVGCQFGPEKTLHKIFYVEDESMETVDLSVRSWAHGNKEEVPWNSSGLVGKRLYVYWEGEYVEDDVQKRAEEKFKSKKTKVPYEAYVVKFLGPHKYRLLYTLDDNLENRNLNDDDADWNVVDAGVTEVDDLPIVSWTGPLEEE